VSGPQSIRVDAGKDRSICTSQNLLINDLNAIIEGDVTDGKWIRRNGDGKFEPGNLTEVRYSIAKRDNISYVPGPKDKLNGYFELTLASDAPVQSDDVMITFQGPPPLFCNSNINISLDARCTQVVDASMLQPNPIPPFTNYIITLYDQSGNIIPNNTLTRKHIDQEITYKLGHQCTANTCWGKFKVEDYYPPIFECKNATILCNQPSNPESVGLPVPVAAKIDSSYQKTYIISDWDLCSKVTLEYKDEIINANCAGDEDKTIIRKWKATDVKGNVATCEQRIVVKRIQLADVIMPPHYDGKDKPAFECGDVFPVLANGHPSPDTTGVPNVGYCGNLQYNMNDVRFDLCGKSFKIVRSWFVIDWCTSLSVTRNQIIMVGDSKGPKITCKDTIQLSASPYHCTTLLTEIPQPLTISDCNEYKVEFNLTTKTGIPANQYIKVQNGKSYLDQLPIGIYHLNFSAVDVCQNSSICTTTIVVKDISAPNVVCDQTTKVALDGTGKGRIFAITFDDGSNDNCGIAGFRARKMTDNCGFGTVYGDYVDFCCAEIGTTVMVALEVTDVHGNTNTCMVEVMVEDKLKPVISCPPNITLACNESYDLSHLEVYGRVVTKSIDVKDIRINNKYHNGLVGKDGLALDNCDVTVTETVTTDIKCYTGTIKRKFVATDSRGLKDSCTQTITILNPEPFNGNDTIQLKWPKNYVADGCKSSKITPDITGNPTFTNTSCANVAATYEDTKFYIADSACVKIIRTWTVLDWCQFDGINTRGKWGPYIQIIKLHNTDKPEFTKPCQDTVFCSFDITCKMGWVHLIQAASDPCTATSDLVWKYDIDLFSNNTVDITGSINDFEGELPLGKHRITWRVEDQCGNFNQCTYSFTITDCKKPSPYCFSSLTSSLMQQSGHVEIWAKDFDRGSTDNCTQANQLIFTFDGWLPVKDSIHKEHYFKNNGLIASKNEYLSGLAQKWTPLTNSSGKYLDCSRIPNGKSAVLKMAMTVTDQAFLQDSCVVELVLQDNNNHCPDIVTEARIAGRITTENNKIPILTDINVEGTEYTTTRAKVNQDGSYSTEKLRLNNTYKISPSLDTNPVEGVTVVDLVHIQRHILGILPFDSPYKMIAADINSSSSISAQDLVELRKLILGITSTFPNNLPSWVFVSKKATLDAKKPYSYVNFTEIPKLTEDVLDADFVAIKMGDVNQSALEFGNQVVENRTSKYSDFPVFMRVESIDGRQNLTFRAGSDIWMDGFQLFTTYPEAEKSVQVVKSVQPSVDGAESAVFSDHIRSLAYCSKPHLIKKGDVLASFVTGSDFDLSRLMTDEGKQSEMYGEGVIKKVKLLQEPSVSGNELILKLINNPVKDIISLSNVQGKKLNDVSYFIVNTDGKRLLSGNIPLINAGEEISIKMPDDNIQGILFLHLMHGHESQTIKFIKLR
jgi:hypothetical protein